LQRPFHSRALNQVLRPPLPAGAVVAQVFAQPGRAGGLIPDLDGIAFLVGVSGLAA
jgi:hypothetical protein